MLNFCLRACLLLILSCTISSCVNIIGNNTRYFSKQGFDKRLIQSNGFLITTFQKITRFGAPYVFYIEGDGAAFNMYHLPSKNPTPRRDTLISLALIDTRPNIIYIARPCQYTPRALDKKCRVQYWTNKRFSDEVVESINQVIYTINNDKKFHLVGFSGGGGIAVLIAARNSMVKDIVTIAGNLDHVSFTNLHNDSPMVGSLNPIDYIAHVRRIPQLHIVGGADRIIPPSLVSEFVKKADSPHVKMKIISKASHNVGWQEPWYYLHRKTIY